MTDAVRYLSVRDFCELGYLLEANRQFFHPLGLSLEVTPDDEGETMWHIRGIEDYRDDVEGMVFDGVIFSESDQFNAERIERERRKKEPERLRRFGWVVQPITVRRA